MKEDVDIVNWAAGRYGSLFLTRLRDEGSLSATAALLRQGLPAAPVVCGPCFTLRRNSGVGRYGHPGQLLRGELSLYRPGDGSSAPSPTLWGIRLDGCDTYLSHFVDETDPAKLTPGLRVKAVFRPREERTGRLQDVLHFKIVE